MILDRRDPLLPAKETLTVRVNLIEIGTEPEMSFRDYSVADDELEDHFSSHFRCFIVACEKQHRGLASESTKTK